MDEKEQKKLSYEDLERVAANMQHQLAEKDAQLRQVNEIREMAYICLQLLEHHEVLPDPMLNKVLDFIDKLIPVPKPDAETKA